MVPLHLSLVALSCLSLAGAEPLHIPLVRKREPLSIENAANALGNQFGSTDPSLSKRQDISLINQFHDTSYMAVVNVGTPPQTFNVVLHTGTSDLWVRGQGCTNCTQNTPTFKNTTSSTFQANRDASGQPVSVSIPYQTGPVVGSVVQDTVSMGDFRVQTQSWLLVSRSPAYLIEGSCSGSMGLAFDTIAWTESVPFWQTLADRGQLTSPEMSFWFTRLVGDADAQEEEFGGVFTLGGRNETLYTGDVEFLPLVTNAGRKTYWLLEISGITVNNQNVTLPPGNVAAVATSTTLIAGPAAVISAIYAQIPGSQPLSGNYAGYYGFPCNTKMQVAMSFGGRFWSIDSRDMNFGPVGTGSDICLGGFFEFVPYSNSTGNPNWIVGVAFLKNVYSVFRYQPAAIGFAELSNTRGVASGVPNGNGNGNNTDDGTDDGDNSNGSGNSNAGVIAQSHISPVVLLATAATLFTYLF